MSWGFGLSATHPRSLVKIPSRFSQVMPRVALAAVCFAFLPDHISQASLHPAGAPTAKSISKPVGLGEFFGIGFTVGGLSTGPNAEYSLIRVQKLANASGVERVIFTFGDREGLPLRTRPGFFQMGLDTGATRLVLDFAQMQKTMVDHFDLARVLKKSALIQNVDMTMDPEDASTNVTLVMREAIEARAFVEDEDRKINQLVVDFRKSHVNGSSGQLSISNLSKPQLPTRLPTKVSSQIEKTSSLGTRRKTQASSNEPGGV